MIRYGVVFWALSSWARAAATSSLVIDATAPLTRVLPRYASVDLDWWPATSTGSGGHWAGASALDLDLGSARLRTFVGALGAGYLRIGGSMDTAVRYGGFGGGDDDLAWCRAPRLWRGANATLCLTAARYEALHAFAAAAGLEIVFGLSYPGVTGGGAAAAPRGAVGDSLSVPPYNGTQNRALLAYSRRRGLPLAAVELGEEMVPPPGTADFGRLIAAYGELRRDLRAVYAGASPPVVVGPCAGMAAETDNDPACAPTCRPSPFLTAFLNATVPPRLVDAVCVHSYNNDATPGLLSQTKRQVEVIAAAVGALSPETPIWCGECGPHNEGGVVNVTDGGDDGFWYVDALGTLATLGVAEFGRQALAGARYGLLDAARDYEPRPDYYALLLWARLMGPTVLRVDGGDATFHAFAHCAGGAVGLAFVNFGDAGRVVDVRFGGRTVAARDEWHLVPGGGAGGGALALNGRPLATAGAALPATAGRRATGPLRAAARSFGFARFAGTCPEKL